MKLSPAIQLLFAACAIGASANASAVFNFAGDSLGTSTGFTDTVDGLSATFSGSVDPGGFVVYPTIFDTLTGNVLGDPGPLGFDNLCADFATGDFGDASPLTLTAYENAQLVGSAQTTGVIPDGFYLPEGHISFAGMFNEIVISSTATDFAVDNIAAVTTPEPGLFPLLALGLAGLVFGSLRARRRSTPV